MFYSAGLFNLDSIESLIQLVVVVGFQATNLNHRVQSELAKAFTALFSIQAWYIDGSSEHVAQALRRIGLFEETVQFVTVLDLIKCLKQFK